MHGGSVGDYKAHEADSKIAGLRYIDELPSDASWR